MILVPERGPLKASYTGDRSFVTFCWTTKLPGKISPDQTLDSESSARGGHRVLFSVVFDRKGYIAKIPQKRPKLPDFVQYGFWAFLLDQTLDEVQDQTWVVTWSTGRSGMIIPTQGKIKYEAVSD